MALACQGATPSHPHGGHPVPGRAWGQTPPPRCATHTSPQVMWTPTPPEATIVYTNDLRSSVRWCFIRRKGLTVRLPWRFLQAAGRGSALGWQWEGGVGHNQAPGHRHAAGGRCHGQPHDTRRSGKTEPTHDMDACLAARACGRWGLPAHPSPRNSRSAITCVLVANSGKFRVRSAVLGILGRALHPRHIFALHAAGGLRQHTRRQPLECLDSTPAGSPWNVCQRAHVTRASVNGELVRKGSTSLDSPVADRADARA